MEIVHVSAECYPVAKAGGLADVVGALPRFQATSGHIVKVIMPMYRTNFLYSHDWEVVHKAGANLGHSWFDFTVIKETTNKLGFELYLVDINGLLDREKIYGYDDDTERFCAFQIAVLSWINSWGFLPGVIHVHDHHTALIPFMVKHCYGFGRLSGIPTVLTIHNAEYQGSFGWDKTNYIPQWDSWKRGMLEWNGSINPLASGVKCAWRVTTVSNTYLNEMRTSSNGLEAVFEYEKGKCSGIINGIDYDVWNPEHDKYLNDHFNSIDFVEGKAKCKKLLCETFGLSVNKPLMIFIGRLVGEKSADLLPQVINDSFRYIGRNMNFLILGSGEKHIEHRLDEMKRISLGDYSVYIGYNEQLSHLMYAGADFLLMPSRVEPCGLNQMYAMRYGTIPIVRRTGGLLDTVVDYGDPGGYGVTFNHASTGDITHAIHRSLEIYAQKDLFRRLQQKVMSLDFSWHKSAEQYLELYRNLQ
jgi:starch synthase